MMTSEQKDQNSKFRQLEAQQNIEASPASMTLAVLNATELNVQLCLVHKRPDLNRRGASVCTSHGVLTCDVHTEHMYMIYANL